MWRCAVLLSVCCVGLAAGKKYHMDSEPLPTFHMDCGPNEYFELCNDFCVPERTCATRKYRIGCTLEPTPCIPKCVCKEGYYRKTVGGKCIPEHKCGPACPEGEEYTECANPCIDYSCAASGSLKPNCTEPCVPGCVCKKDYFKQYEYSLCWPKCFCEEHRDSPECSPDYEETEHFN